MGEQSEEKKTDFSKQMYFVILVIAVILFAAVLKTLSSIILPVVFSVLLGFVFMPIVRKMQKKFHIPWTVGSVLVTVLAVIIFFGISSILATSLSSILSQFPKYENRFMTIYKVVAEQFNLEFDEGKTFFENIWGFDQIRTTAKNLTLLLSTGIVTVGKSFFMVFFLLAFFLIALRLTNEKLTSAFKQEPAKRKKFYRLSISIVTEITRFLSIKFFISLATGLVVFLGTLAIGVDFPIVWGFLAFVMNFIPAFGSIFSGILTTLFTLIQFYPSLWQTLIVLILMLSVNMLLGNIIEPKIEGENLGLSPFVILISLSLWGYIWGFLGLLLAVPMTVIIKIICENVSYLKFAAVLLGNSKEQKSDKLNKS